MADDWSNIADELTQTEDSDAKNNDDSEDNEASPSDAATPANTSNDETQTAASNETDPSRSDDDVITDESDESDADTELTLEDRMSSPAFEYSECKQSALHPREEQWRTYEAALSMANGLLAQKGITKVEKRELDDAAIRLTNEYHEELVRLVLEARGIDPDEI